MNPLPPFAPHALRIDMLACRRGGRRVFDALSQTVGPGRVLALRGPNGSGKTSLLLMLAGVLRPDGGAVAIDRPDPDLPAREALCFLRHQSALKPRLSVRENLAFWHALYPSPLDPASALARVGLGGAANLPALRLSTGQAKRLNLARLLLANRPVWLLDEPAVTLDTAGARLLGALLDEHLLRGGLAVAAIHDDLVLSDPARLLHLDMAARMGASA